MQPLSPLDQTDRRTVYPAVESPSTGAWPAVLAFLVVLALLVAGLFALVEVGGGDGAPIEPPPAEVPAEGGGY